MPYQAELSFFFDVLKKSHVHAGVLPHASLGSESVRRRLHDEFGETERLLSLFREMEEQVLYRFTDSFACSYLFMLLRTHAEPELLYIGPYLREPLSDKQILELGEQNAISPQQQRVLSEYYAGLAVLSEDCPILTMLHCLCERLWSSSAVTVRDVSTPDFPQPSESPFSRSMLALEPKDTLVNLKAIERRYEFENEMIRSVSLGQSHMEARFRQAFSDGYFEKRAADPLRNAKNYGVIMNTLLRKAAENGGVHPVHLDRVSSEFARRIEEQSALSENAPLMLEMFRTYCRLVRTHSLREFSALVQRTILMIESDLSADLSPRVLAEALGVSLGYLSTVFKRETGQTMSAYIRTKRMEYAEYLLGRSNLQIQNVALHCGIMDVQYFTKLFKRHVGVTPSEYRHTRQRKPDGKSP